ncbi:hypothetical protein A2U01_0057655 [Trifolium medium]|uniref:Uncharacterized protein n=1 Tax=Trifolium medium TaxID=97028 RepID=A0A392RJU5_9FABA|nr:hypothetical protein [Trifolium medium]
MRMSLLEGFEDQRARQHGGEVVLGGGGEEENEVAIDRGDWMERLEERGRMAEEEAVADQ